MAETFDILLGKGRPFLRQYLEDNNIEIIKKGSTSFIRCIHPDHNDTNPSCAFVKASDDQYLKCYSCGGYFDIYNIASIIEGKPLHGLSFVKENVEYILNKYGIDFTPIEVSEEKCLEMKYDFVYKIATNLMVAEDSLGELIYTSLEHTAKRNWKKDVCKQLIIGSVKDYNSFLDKVVSLSKLTKEEVVSMGIRPTIFNKHLITFSMKDSHGTTKGFAARDTTWKEGSLVRKYNNTSIEDNPFFKKDFLIYNLDLAKKYSDLRLDIFEGYGSVVTAIQAGHRNCVAIGGTNITDNHVHLLRSLGFSNINLILDQDGIGDKFMERYIEKFSGYPGLIVSLTNLPFSEEDKKIKGFNDPDAYIQKYGIQAYRSLKPIGIFEHLIMKNKGNIIPSSPEAVQFCRKMVKVLIGESDLIERAQMISALSEHTGIDKDDIKDEITRIEKTDIKNIKDILSKQIRDSRDTDQLLDVLSKAEMQIDDSSSTKKDRYLISLSESVSVFDDIFNDMNNQKEGIHGWKTDYPELDNLLDGIPKPTNGGVAIGFAAGPQHGKSAAMLNISLSLVLNNKDVSVLYWAIDDNRKAIAYRLVSMLSEVSIKKVRKMAPRSPEETRKINEAQEILRSLIADRKLVFKDDRFGRSPQKAEAWIKDTQDNTSNGIVFCVDSLHNVGTNSASSETRTRIMSSSIWLKKLCATIPCTVLASIELVKNRGTEKPTLMAISESGKIEFDFDTLGIVWNQAQGAYSSIQSIDMKWGSIGNYKPIIEVDFQKNKASAGEKGSVYFNYDPETTKFVSCARKPTIGTDSVPLIQGKTKIEYNLGEVTKVLQNS